MFHLDKGEVTSFEKTPEGFLRVTGTIARVGWLLYRDANGGQRWEYVPPETLFNEDHLDSIGMSPLTLGHPSEKVTPGNWKRYAVGSSGNKVIARQDKGLIDVVYVVADDEAIKSVESGKTKQLSMGYDCLTSPRDDGKFNQIKRVCNHHAIVEVARAGPDAKLHLDGWEQIGYDDKTDAVVIDIKPREDKWRIISVMA